MSEELTPAQLIDADKASLIAALMLLHGRLQELSAAASMLKDVKLESCLDAVDEQIFSGIEHQALLAKSDLEGAIRILKGEA